MAITPTRVNQMVRAALTRGVPATLHVLGEICDLSRPGSGHAYFCLKDQDSELRCVMWRSDAVRLKFVPQDGMQVIATGGLDVYSPRGTYQLIVRRLEPRGAGALEVAFRQLKARLAQEGLFDPQRKRRLPRVPQRVAVITSPSGAAIRDILQTLARRFPALELLVFPVRVQGEGAAVQIAAAIRAMNAAAERLGGIDVAIVGRGGGSLEDLWAFNEEVVARAIFDSRVPIVSAVGHEVDVSISDLVADVRAATPTAAAELIAPVLSDLLGEIDARRLRLARGVRHALEIARHRLDARLRSEWLARPEARLRHYGQRVDEACARIEHARARRFHRWRERLSRAEHAIVRFGAGVGFARVEQRVQQKLARLTAALHERFRTAERGLDLQIERIERRSGVALHGRLAERLAAFESRARLALATRVRQDRAALAGRLEVLRACDPKRVLRRGYSITRIAKTRQIVRSVEQIRDGMRIITELADGEFRSTADDPRQPRLFPD